MVEIQHAFSAEVHGGPTFRHHMMQVGNRSLADFAGFRPHDPSLHRGNPYEELA